MSTLTNNFNFIKAEGTDAADFTALNANWDTVDEELAIAKYGATVKLIRETPYNIVETDVGKCLNIAYVIRDSNIVVNLTDTESKKMPIGAEILITRNWGTNLTIKTDGLQVAVPGVLSSGTSGLTTPTQHSFTVSNAFNTITLKKIETATNGDAWLLIESAPVNSPTFNGTMSLNGFMKLNSNSYGDTLPSAGTVGRVFFKKV